MDASDTPRSFPEVFAKNATGSYKRNIPVTTGDTFAASLDLGFPPDTFLPEGSGGKPPNGSDFNGILEQVSAWCQWLEAGGAVYYDGTFSAAVGGYPEGARLAVVADPSQTWISLVDGNTDDPDAGPSGNWTLQSTGVSRNELPQGSYQNIQIIGTTSGGHAACGVSVDRISASDSSGNVYSRSSNLTISAASFLLSNSAPNGLFGGSAAANTLYYVYIIYDPTNNIWAGMLDSLATRTAGPGLYTAVRRIGCVRTGAAANAFLPSTQKDTKFEYTAALLLGNGAIGSVTAPTWSQIQVSSSSFNPAAPTTASSFRLFANNHYNGGTVASMILAPNNGYGASASATPPPLFMGSGDTYSQQQEFVNETGSVYWASSAAGGSVWLLGWDDSL